MTEKLLQFIWKHRYFNQQGLELLSGERLTIEFPGEENTGQGPDFLLARLTIGGNYWVGSVELHILSSDWVKHRHSTDGNYRNVILHVVWKQDHPINTLNIPQLELYNRIPRLMLETYAGWMRRPYFIPCEASVSKTKNRTWEIWASEMLVRRLNRKMQAILESLDKNHYHWEEQMWWMLAANFGNQVNHAAFEAIAKSIPFLLLAKHRQQTIQLEALLMGQANLLHPALRDPYGMLLRREYYFLKKKYDLGKIYEPVYFLRMRPGNFPGIRLSQLAVLYAENTSLFSWILQCESLPAVRKKLMIRANDYWHNHYVFEKKSPFREKMLGPAMAENIIINSIVPLLYTYGKMIPDPAILEKAIRWLNQLPAEQNHLTEGWKRIGVSVKKAPGSQALTELKKRFCDHRKCLDCDIGKQLLLPSSTGESD